MDIIDNVPAHTVEAGDQIIIEGDPIEVRSVNETSDIDEIVIVGYSHESGDTETYSLYADDTFDLWAV